MARGSLPHAPRWPVSGLAEATRAAFPEDAASSDREHEQRCVNTSSAYRCGGSAGWV
jgi:hypothetical protein